MKNKIVIFNLILVTLSVLLVFFFGIAASRRSHYAEAEKEVVAITQIYAQNYTSAQKTVTGVPDPIRVSVINAAGNVVADSGNVDVSQMENHLEREEIVAAFSEKPKTVVRYSDTLGKDMVYYALKVQDGDAVAFIRVAIPVESVNGYVVSTASMMVYVLIFALLVSFIASLFATNSLMKPLRTVRNNLVAVKNGTYQETLPATGDAELNGMLAEINGISERLQQSMAQTRAEKEKLHAILRDIADGIVVLDTQGMLELMNQSACKIFGIHDVLGKHYSVLTADPAFLAQIGQAAAERREAAFVWENGRGIVCSVSGRALERGLYAVVLTDITAAKNAEQMRSEFFANASHELKTPLTAIKGFNDLVALQTQEESVKALSQKIDKEVERIIRLLNDMLDLSRIEAEKEPKTEAVDLAATVEGGWNSLAPLAAQKQVSVETTGEATVNMDPEYAVELVKNLAENAIRYNRPGGKVQITLQQTEKEVTLSVQDDGIGIGEEDQKRIFERFYRVNKSRSRESGGTGLGLSIVKHICMLYHADLVLTSKLGVGTTVTVTFSKAD